MTNIENPRWYQTSKGRIDTLQQCVSHKDEARQLRREQQKQARRRLDFLHKTANRIVRHNAPAAMGL